MKIKPTNAHKHFTVSYKHSNLPAHKIFRPRLWLSCGGVIQKNIQYYKNFLKCKITECFTVVHWCLKFFG